MPRPTLIVLGTGFAAFSLIKSIDTELYDVVVVSPRNHFIFTPLLPSTAVGTIEFRSIIESIRFAKSGIRYFESRCLAVDPVGNAIRCGATFDDRGFNLSFGVLVIAVGAVSNTYRIPGVEDHALLLRELSDARAIRQKIIDCMEQASMPSIAAAEKTRLLHFIIVGGGPTGVELAAEMNDFLAEDLRRGFPSLVRDVKITLLEATDHLLSTFDAALSSYTLKHFRRQKIDARTEAIVTRVDKAAVYLKSGEVIPYGMLVWSTGIGPTALVQSLPFTKDTNGRLIVDEFLHVAGRSDIYALGDCATFSKQNLPATAQVAQQEGYYLGKALNRHAVHKTPKPFVYKNLGMLAYIGDNQALADLAAIKTHGFATWLFWRSAYLTRLVSIKNKLLVIFDWFKTLVFGRDISRF